MTTDQARTLLSVLAGVVAMAAGLWQRDLGIFAAGAGAMGGPAVVVYARNGKNGGNGAHH